MVENVLQRLRLSLLSLTSAGKRRHNATVSISRLPLELFNYILDQALNSGDRDETYHIHLSSWRLVCDSWNEIIANSPGLWTTVVSTQPKAFVSTALLRSKQVPLLVTMVQPDSVEPEGSYASVSDTDGNEDEEDEDAENSDGEENHESEGEVEDDSSSASSINGSDGSKAHLVKAMHQAEFLAMVTPHLSRWK